MPELPEVETVRRGLAPALEGATIDAVTLARSDLRIPFPPEFSRRLEGARIAALTRRGKYLVAPLSTGESLIVHLGMTGRFLLPNGPIERPGEFYYLSPPDPAHSHVVFTLRSGRRRFELVYNDARRFGLMDLVPSSALKTSRHFARMGPEPLTPEFTTGALAGGLAGKTMPIKVALLDQRVAAGLGNIYACEALHAAGVSPKRAAGRLGPRISDLRAAICSVLEAGIAAGGSTLRDFAAADGRTGGFQERFAVYDREGEPCPACAKPVRRIVQAGRSTFYCSACQR